MRKLKENLDPESVVKTTDDFAEYLVNNFIPKEQRNKVEHDLSNIIMDTFEEYMEENENPTEDEIIQNLNQREDQLGEFPMKELFNIDIQSVIDSIVKRSLTEAEVPLGPDEKPVDDQETVARKAKMSTEFDDLSANDLNGPDPLKMKPEETTLLNAIEEYANQTGKQMHIQEFKDIILGILHEFDDARKIGQLKRFIGTLANTTTNLREPQEYEEDVDLGGGEEMPPDIGGEEPDLGAEPETSRNGQEGESELDSSEMENKMKEKKNSLQGQ